MKRLYNMLGGRLALALQGDLRQSFAQEEGQTLVEYALILALIAIVVAAALTFLQGDVSSLFSKIGSKL